MEDTRQVLFEERLSSLKDEVISRIDLSRDVPDSEVKEIIKEAIYSSKKDPPLSLSERSACSESYLMKSVGWGSWRS